MMHGKLQALCKSLRPAGGRASRTKASTMGNSRVLDDIGRECTAVGNVLRLRAKEQTVETLLRQRVYQETTEPYERLKEICSTPKKKKSTKRSKRRAAEVLTALVHSSKKEESSAVSERLSLSAKQFLARLKHRPSTTKILRRHSFITKTSPYSDLVSKACCERSIQSFIGSTGHRVEAV